MKPFQRIILETLVPIILVGGSLLLTQRVHAFQNTLFVFLGAVMVSAWYGEWYSGILATILAAIVTAYNMPPANSLTIGDSADLERWLLFLVIAIAITSLQASRVKSEQLRRRSDQRLALALDSARMGVWDYNLLSRTFWWSKSLERIYDRAEDFPSTYGQFFALIHFDDQPMFNRAITKTIDEGTDYEVEHRIMMRDGTYKMINTRGRVFFNERGRAERIVGVAQDINTRKQVREGAPPLEPAQPAPPARLSPSRKSDGFTQPLPHIVPD